MKRVIIERNRYFDSVFLMRISSELEKLEGVTQAAVAMATPLNVENLARSGFSPEPGIAPLRPADLVIAIEADSEAASDRAHARVVQLLTGRDEGEERASTTRPSSLEAALADDPAIQLAVISVPGTHAAREARQALHRGLHVMLFSDNVAVEDELRLKDEAIRRGLMMMGPDCGTAIIQGVPLGFANACRSGVIGIVGASGTGIQEISSLIHRWGGGISQAIGTGGRDLSEAVGGRMTRFGIASLGADPQTHVIVVVSKSPSPGVAEAVIAAVAETGKPSVIHFIGEPAKRSSKKVEIAATLADAARSAVAKSGIDVPPEASRPVPAARKTTGHLGTTPGRAVGMFCGGTLCQETWSILHQAGLEVFSNVAVDSSKKISPSAQTRAHVLWDLGDDAFTVGKPHPMIEPRLRDDRVAEAGADPSVGLILADCVIGYGAHENPAASLADGAVRAFDAAGRDGRKPIILASVTGTDQDPQNYSRQRRILEQAGIVVAPSNAAAARMAVAALEGGRS